VAGAWGIVTLALLLKTLFDSVRIAIAARTLRPLRDPALVELLNDCCRLLNIQTPPALLEAPAESGPALVGLMHLRLLLPVCVVDQFAWRELRHVILHELVHLKRRDILVNYLASLVQAVHWFNPLVWLAAARMRAERELACDEAVLSVSPWREGRAYGSTIVKLLELLSRGAVPAGAMGVIGHRAQMHRRIAMIARFDGSRRHWSASGLLLSAAVLGAALAGAVRAQVQPASEPPAAQAATEPKDSSPDEAGAAAAVHQEATRAEEPAAAQPEAQDPAETPSPATALPPAGDVAAGSVAAAEPPVANEAVTPPRDPTLPRPPGPGEARSGRGFGGGFGGGSFGGGGGGVVGGSARGGAGSGPFGGGMMGRRGGFGGGGVMPPTEPQFATIEDAAAAKADAKTLEKLQRPMPMQVDNEPLGDVLNMLAQKGGFDILVDNRALGEANIDQNTAVQINIREPQPIEQLLHFVLRQAGGDEVGFSLMHGVVLVSNRVELARHVVTRVYDISDLGSPDEVQQTLDQTIGTGVNVHFLKTKLIVTTSEPNQREVAKLLTLLRQEAPPRAGGGVGLAPGVAPRELKAVQLRHTSASDTAKRVQSALGDKLQLDVASDDRNNTLILTGPGDALREAEDLARKLDAGDDSSPQPDAHVPAPSANR
jgi:beta-lactamase regulating signal transducer with metallopeptidase domain